MKMIDGLTQRPPDEAIAPPVLTGCSACGSAHWCAIWENWRDNIEQVGKSAPPLTQAIRQLSPLTKWKK